MDEAPTTGERPCRVCGQSKPLDSFVSGSPEAGRVRRHRVCRACRSQADRAYRDAHPEQRERFKQWRRELHRPHQGAGERRAATEEGQEAERGEPSSTHQTS